MSRKRVFASLSLALGLVLIFSVPVAAQSSDQPAHNPALSLKTDYPTMVIGIDDNVTIELTLSTETEAQIVDLSVDGLPSGWSSSFRGGSHTVKAAYVEPGNSALVSLRVEPPAAVEPGSYQFQVVADGNGVEASLPVEIIVQERVPANLTFDIDLPTLRGRPSTTFRYSVALNNEGDEDLTADLFAQAPNVFQVVFKSAGQEVTSIPIEANSSKSLSVEAQPLLNVIPAADYTITLRAQSGDVSTSTEVVAEVVGQSSIGLKTPDGRLSGRAVAGDETSYTILVQNTGSAPATGITLSSTPPTGWTVSFDPQEIDVLGPGQQQEVGVSVQPNDKALAGDYIVTFRATPENENVQTMDFRVTVRTSTLWGVVGIGLIAISVGVVGWAVMRFGRR
ncbi:MAG: NEW3 domain-containing protein [Anaerolineales bacterium]|jgi:uncharacterized repeat protein (TIGR01451 family)